MNYRNARYITETIIDCELYHPKYGWIPYTLNPLDTDNTIDSKAIIAEIEKNKDAIPYTPPTKEEIASLLANEIRNQRDFMLATKVDPLVTNPLRWADLSPEQKTKVETYRKALLDITTQKGFPETVVWPELAL